jgi:hypothetical protein
LAADTTHERSNDLDDGDFVSYLAQRLGVEAREARERVSAWLTTYEPPPKSGPRRAVPRADGTDEPIELERSA